MSDKNKGFWLQLQHFSIKPEPLQPTQFQKKGSSVFFFSICVLSITETHDNFSIRQTVLSPSSRTLFTKPFLHRQGQTASNGTNKGGISPTLQVCQQGLMGREVPMERCPKGSALQKHLQKGWVNLKNMILKTRDNIKSIS